MKSESIKMPLLRAFAVVVLICSILFLLLCGLEFFIAGFVRDHSAIEIDGDNRAVVASLLHENMENDEEMPDIENAVKIEYLSLLHKEEVTITFNDETTFRFYIKNRYKNPLLSYIKDNGYVSYFRSAEFVGLAVKTGILFSLCIASTAILKKTKPKPAPKRYRIERITKRITK